MYIETGDTFFNYYNFKINPGGGVGGTPNSRKTTYCMINSVKGLILTKLNPRYNNFCTTLIEMAQKGKRLGNTLLPSPHLELVKHSK